MYQEFNWIVGIGIGVALIVLGWWMSFSRFPKKTDSPDITILHLKWFYLESYTLIVGGLFLVTLSLLLASA